MSKTKKVLFVATVGSHINCFHIPYLKLFKENEYEVHVATGDNEEINDFCDRKITIPVTRSPYKFSNIKAVIKLKKIINKEKYDIIHCHTPMGSVVTRLAAKKSRKKFGTKVIYTAHGFHFYHGAPKLNWLLFYPVEWFLSKYTDTLITINKEDYELAKNKFSKRCHDIQYVPGVGIDTEKFNIKMSINDKEELKNSLGLDKNDYILSCVARLDKNKNQGFLINVMESLVKEHKNIHLLLIGQDELNGFYQNIVKEKKLESNIHFLGRRNDIPELLSITDIVVSASQREGLPVNVMEAFAAGKPVVALDCRGMKDLIEDGKNGFIVEFNSVDEFCAKVIDFFKRDILYNEVANYNLSKSKKYIIEYIKKYYDDMYFRRKKLMFIHGGAMMKKSLDGELFCGGSYSKEIWLRYYEIADEVTVLFRIDKKGYPKEELIKKYQPFYKNNKLCTLYNISESKNPLKVIKYFIFNKRIIKDNVLNSDIVVARVPSFISYLAIRYAKKYNKTLLTEVVGCAFDSLWNHSFVGKILAFPELLMQKYYVKISNNVMYVSSSFLQKRYPNKFNNIGLSDVILEDFDDNLLKARINKINNYSKKIIIGTVGAVNIDYKGQQYVIKAIKKLSNISDIKFEYQLVGSGNSIKLRKLAERLDVLDSIIFLGPLSHEKVMKWYEKIDLYIQPSNTEGLCRSIIEAMSKGCPCIVSNAGGNVELINNSFVFKKKNVNHLVQLINKMSVEEMIKQAKINFNKAKEYDFVKINRERFNFYKSL